MEFVSVRIVPAQALGTPQPPAPRPEPEPAPPEPEPEEPEPEPEEEEPELPAPEPEAPKPEPKKPEPRTAEPPRPRPPAQQPSRTEPAPPSQGTPGSRQGAPTGSPTGTAALGAQVAAIGDPDFTYGYYLDRVLAAIEAQWRRPPTDGAVVEVALDFRIRRDGTVAELDVAESSGFNAFDLAGLRAVQAASPLPPLPAGYRQDSLAIRLLIR
jgi:TonB family protein